MAFFNYFEFEEDGEDQNLDDSAEQEKMKKAKHRRSSVDDARLQVKLPKILWNIKKVKKNTDILSVRHASFSFYFPCARFFEQSPGLANILDRAFCVVLCLFAACFTEWYSRRFIFIWCGKWRMVWSLLTGNCCRPVDKCLYVENLVGVPVGKADELLTYTGRCLRQETLWILASETKKRNNIIGSFWFVHQWSTYRFACFT